tara:strand:+ start:1829 stop:2014 length:186 start_codon:yes stop_codon:yes gene_type:complete
LIAGVVSPVAVFAGWGHPILRFFYIGAYVCDIPTARGFCWALGVLCTTLMYKEGLTAFLNS